MRGLIVSARQGLLAAVALAGVAVAPTPGLAMSDMPSNCWWVPWYDVMNWYYGISGYCNDSQGLWWFDDQGNYGKA